MYAQQCIYLCICIFSMLPHTQLSTNCLHLRHTAKQMRFPTDTHKQSMAFCMPHAAFNICLYRLHTIYICFSASATCLTAWLCLTNCRLYAAPCVMLHKAAGLHAQPSTTCSAISAHWWHARVSHAHSCGKFVLSLFCMQIEHFFSAHLLWHYCFCALMRLQASVCCNLKMSSGFLGARHAVSGDSGDGGSATSGYLMRVTIAPMVLLIARHVCCTCVYVWQFFI